MENPFEKMVVVLECTCCHNFFPESKTIRTKDDTLCFDCYDEIIQASLDSEEENKDVR